MTKGELTREVILDEAAEVAGRVGLAGLTIGSLASRVEMSKSGLFAHFQSKEALQLKVLAHARERFVDRVVRPALATPRGEPRVWVLFERWLECANDATASLFVSASAEFDDQPGAIRDQLVSDHWDLMDAVAQIFRTGISERHFRADVDAAQFAHDLHGVMLAYFYAHRLLRDAAAEAHTRRAFEALLAAARPAGAERPGSLPDVE